MDNLKELSGLSEIQISVLNYHESELVDKMKVMVTLNGLVQQGVFNEQEEKDVLSETTIHGRAKQILTIILTKNEECFDKFLIVLSDCGQAELANSLRQDTLHGDSLHKPVQTTQSVEDTKLEPMECDDPSTGSFSFEMKVEPQSQYDNTAEPVESKGERVSEASNESMKEEKTPVEESSSPKTSSDIKTNRTDDEESSSPPSASSIRDEHSVPSISSPCCNNEGSTLLPTAAIMHLPPQVWKKLVDALSVERESEKDWRVMAHYLGYDKQKIALLKQGQPHKNAAEIVLKDWEVRKEATVGRLCQILDDNDMGQISEILKLD